MRVWSVPLVVALLMCCAVGGAAGRSWRLQRTPAVPGQQDGALNAVSCATASVCFGAGTYTNHHGFDRNLIERWNGLSWSTRSTPNPRHDAGFNGVSCTAATTCMAVGGSSSLWSDRLSGGSWHFQYLQTARAVGRLRAVSCATGLACTAVGFSGPETNVTALAERWNGRHWSRGRVPLPRGASDGELKAVSCTAPDACVAVGDYGLGTGVLAERWDGRRWRDLRAPNPAGGGFELNAVSCSSRSWCEAAGDYTRSNGSAFFGLVEHWNGKHWTIERVHGPSGRSNMFELEAISCGKPGSCTAVGASANRQLRTYVLAEHLFKGTWSVQPTPNPAGPGGTLYGISCLRAGVCVAVGAQGFMSTTAFAERFS